MAEGTLGLIGAGRLASALVAGWVGADAANAGYTAVEAQVRHLFHRELPARMGRAGSAVP